MNALDALTIARVAHEGQYDAGGYPYIEHPLAVRDLLRTTPGFDELTEDERVIARDVALLHDVLEDVPRMTVFGLVNLGISYDVTDRVELLTRIKGQEEEDYYGRIMTDAVATVVKRADVRHNANTARLAGVPEPRRGRLVAKYAKAQLALKFNVI